MSDIEDLKRMLQEIQRESRNPSAGSGGNNAADTRSYRERMDDLIKSSKDAGDSFKKLNGGLKLTNRAQFEHRVALQEAQSELYDLEVALRKHRKGTDLLTDAQLKAVEARRKELSGMMQQGQGMERFTAGVEKWGKFLIGYYTQIQQVTLQGIGQVLSTVQSGGSGFAIANAQMAMSLDVANAHVQQMSQATQMAGASIAMIPGFASKLVGLGMVIGAEAKKSASQLQTDAKKMFNQLLMAGGDQLLKAYEGLTKGGVLLAGGADDMRKALTANGEMQLTFQTFERMVQGSAQLLADTNMGLGKAAAMMGQIAARMKASGVDKAFQALGIGLEDTGPLIAQVMKDFARAGRKLTAADTPEVQQRTIEYAKNLALLSQLSGKTVKEELAKRAQAESEFGYRAKMAQLGERAHKDQATVMSGLSASTRAAVVELERFGFIKNEDVRNMAQLIPEFGQYLNTMAREFGNGTLSIEKELELRQKMGPALQNSLKNNPLLADLAVARTKLEGPLNSFMEEYDRTMRSAADTVKETRETIEARYKKGLEASLESGTLDGTLLAMKSIGEEFAAKFQENIIDRIGEIGGLLKDALANAKKLLETGPTVNTGPLSAIEGLADKFTLLALGVMAVTYAFKGIKSAYQAITGKTGTTTTTTETVKTENAKVQEQSKLSKIKERLTPRGPSGAQLDIARMELGLSGNATKAEIEAARAARMTAKYGKYIKGAGVVGVLAQGYTNVSNASQIREDEKAGKITATEANAKVTAEAFDFAGALGTSAAGGKVGALIGASVGVWFGGVGAAPGAIIGGILGAIGGGLLYFLSPLQTWTKKIGEGFSTWWQSWTFKGVWDSIGKGLGSAMTVVSDWADGAYKTVTGWFNFGDKPKQPPTPASQQASSSQPPAPTPVSTQVTTALPKGLAMYSGGLGVSLMKDGNFVSLDAQGKIAFAEAFTTALKGAHGGAGSLGTTSFSTGFYKPKLNPQGKAVTEADFAEIGKGDPVVYALGKLTKIAAESASDMRSLATKMGASLDTQGDSRRYLKNMQSAFR
jgi:hypothetical protein